RVVTAGIEALHFDDRIDAATGTAALEEDDVVDRFRDKAAGNRDDGFLGKLFQTVEGGTCRVCVYGGDSTWVSGVPGLEHVEGFRPPDLADDDPVRAQPE